MVVPCPCAAGPVLPKKLRREELEELTEQTQLKPAEVKALYARFRRLAPGGYLFPEQFKQTMGVLGLSDDPFLPDRMFSVFDSNQDGKLSFFEFASSLAVMIRGTEDEKLKLSFDMTAGHRGAAGISLEDFQRLVSACHTMMSALVDTDTSRQYTSSEDVTRIFHELASGGSSGEENQAVISLEAYKNAVQNSEDFLVCLGLEPRPRRRLRSTTLLQTGSTSVTVPVQQSSVLPDGQIVISAAQLEELRNRVASLRRAAQRHRPHHPPAWCGACSPPQTTTPSSGDDSDERWWTPICGCTPQQKAAPSTTVLSREYSEIRAHQRQLNPFEEICEELDGIVGWCAQCSDGHHPHNHHMGGMPPQPHWSSPGACSSKEAPSLPSRDGMSSRDASREIPAESLSRPHVHGPSVTRPAQARPIQSSAVPTPPSQRPMPRNRNSAAVVSNASNSRNRRRHRLLGPKKGLAVHFGHENWNMVLSMMIGIRMSVGRTKGEMMRELQPVDFIMKEKFTIIPRLANIFDSTVSKRVTMTRFMDYAPLVFQRIRSSFGIVHDDYLHSVGPDQLLGNMVLGNLSSLSELSSEGKSGAFFYYTADGKYMMKTVTPKEHQLLKKMLKKYYDHIMENPGTLIVRFLGLHSLRVHKERKAGFCMKPLPLRRASRKLYFVVMGNMFNTPVEIHRRYDLKGSWVGRITPIGRFDPSVALKDMDFKEANETVRVGEERRAKLIEQIESDSNFLRDNNIIDYSLLLGIHDLGTGTAAAVNGTLEDTTSECASDKAAERCLPTPLSPVAQSSTGWGVQPEMSLQHHREPLLADGHEVPMHQSDMGGMLSSDTKSLYFCGIIDILTPYDSAKKLEHHFKAMRYDSHGVSCCPPGLYAQRFNDFMRRAFV